MSVVTKACVPNILCRALKNFWNDDPDQLQQQSIDEYQLTVVAIELWKSAGKPHSESINKARIQIKNDYKHAVRMAAVDFELSHIDEFTE